MTKLTYHGLKTQRSTVECTTLMDASKVNLKAKTKSQDWMTESNSRELGLGQNDNFSVDNSTGNVSWDFEF